MQSGTLTTQANIVQQLNSNPPLPATFTSTSTGVSENCGDSLQEILNNIADQPTNFGQGCGVALRKKMDDIKKQCTELKKSAEDFKAQCKIFKDHLLPSFGSLRWFDKDRETRAIAKQDAEAAGLFGLILGGTKHVIDNRNEQSMIDECFRKAEEMDRLANNCGRW